MFSKINLTFPINISQCFTGHLPCIENTALNKTSSEGKLDRRLDLDRACQEQTAVAFEFSAPFVQIMESESHVLLLNAEIVQIQAPGLH